MSICASEFGRLNGNDKIDRFVYEPALEFADDGLIVRVPMSVCV